MELFLGLYFWPLLGLLFFGLGAYAQHRARAVWALGLFLLGAAFLHFGFAFLDPYLHPWDERFHALVARNLAENPFYPVLYRQEPLLPYNYQDWCCNHIWVHKQPLFLWQMALSIKVFGAEPWAVRLPTALLAVLAAWALYDVVYLASRNRVAALSAIFLSSTAYFLLELSSGRMSLDHNDAVFAHYNTLAFWSWARYREELGRRPWFWALLTGFFLGCAVLVKWLTAFLLFGGWGLWLLFQWREGSWGRYLHLLGALFCCCLVFLPWQFYIMSAFPREAAWEYEFNRLHIFTALDGHEGPWYYHFRVWPLLYGWAILPLFLYGVYHYYRLGLEQLRLTWAKLAMLVVVYGFFSMVQTKMPAFTLLVYPIFIFYSALALAFLLELAKSRPWLYCLGPLVLWLQLRPNLLYHHRGPNEQARQVRLANTRIYRQLDAQALKDHIILNTAPHDCIEVMFFWPDLRVHHWFPEDSNLIFRLQEQGYKIAAFQNEEDRVLPAYLEADTAVLKLPVLYSKNILPKR